MLGSLILFPGGSPLFRVNPWLIATMTILISGLLAFIISRIVRAHRRQATTGREELIGKTAVAKTVLNPEGTIFFKGELWQAVAEKGRIEAGEQVVINRVESLKLWVFRKE